jgi:hypothetical protein
VAEVFAGFVSGYGLALITAPLLGIFLLKARSGSGYLASTLPAGTSPVALVVVLHGILFFVWTGIGLILGMLLIAMRDSPPAPGTPNAAFTLLVLALTTMLLAPVIFAAPRLRHLAGLTAIAMILVFAFLMPNLAGWTKFNSS